MNFTELFGQAAHHHTDGRVEEVGTQYTREANLAFAPSAEPTAEVRLGVSTPGLKA